MAKPVGRSEWELDDAEAAALVAGTHGDPFARLGLQQSNGQWIARCVIPGADEVNVETLSGTPLGTLTRHHEGGFFEGPVKATGRAALRYRARNQTGEWSLIDPYSFGPVLGPMDDYYVAQGTHLR